MNRATADNQSAHAEEEGLEPTKEWVKDLVDEVIADEFASPDLELAWLDEETGAAQAEAALEARAGRQTRSGSSNRLPSRPASGGRNRGF